MAGSREGGWGRWLAAAGEEGGVGVGSGKENSQHEEKTTTKTEKEAGGTKELCRSIKKNFFFKGVWGGGGGQIETGRRAGQGSIPV